jgi:hypothetical protein
MTLPREYPLLSDYALSDEAAAYIADALMELALEFEATHLAQIRRHHKSLMPEPDDFATRSVPQTHAILNDPTLDLMETPAPLRSLHVTTYRQQAGEAEAGSAGEQPAEE